MFEAFETPLGARETDRTWRGMVARARREYLVRLMPIWAAVLTLASLVLGLPGLYLLGEATGLSGNESVLVALDRGPLSSSLAVVSRWIDPLVSVLSPTGTRFGLEAFVIGMMLMLALASLVRAAGSRQWFQSVYDDIPLRRWMLLGLLWVALPLILGFLLMFFGALMVEVEDSPATVGILVAIVSVVVLCTALLLFYLTFSVREPAIPSLIVGALVAAVLLCLAAVVVEWIPGLRTLTPEETSPFRALITLSVFLFVVWSIVLAGSQLAVALARRHDPIQRFTNASRGEQLDFALGLVRDLESQTRSKRWAQVGDLAHSLAAPTAMVTFALDRLRRSGIVSFKDDGNRPPQHWSICNDLEALTLNDLSRAMGTNLDPLPGLHGRTNEEIIRELAEREHLSQTQNLLSLFRNESGIEPVGEPMLAVTDVDYNFGEQDAFAASQAFEPVAQVVDRTTGDNGGPVQGDESYVFVDTVVDENLVLNVHSGPSALLDPDEGEDMGAAVALDLTTAMRIASSETEDETPVPSGADDPDAPITVSAVAEGGLEDDAVAWQEPAPLKLGDASPLAAVRDEIDHLLLGDELPVAQPITPMKAWRRDADAARAAATTRARPKPVLVPAGPAEAVEPVGSWKLSMIPLRSLDTEGASMPSEPYEPSEPALTHPLGEPSAPVQNSEWLLPVQPKQAWRREAADVTPIQSWKRGTG